MVQEEIIKVLEESKEPLSFSEIQSRLNGANRSKILRALASMTQYNEIRVIEIDRILAIKFYKCKKKMKLYCL